MPLVTNILGFDTNMHTHIHTQTHTHMHTDFADKSNFKKTRYGPSIIILHIVDSLSATLAKHSLVAYLKP